MITLSYRKTEKILPRLQNSRGNNTSQITEQNGKKYSPDYRITVEKLLSRLQNSRGKNNAKNASEIIE